MRQKLPLPCSRDSHLPSAHAQAETVSRWPVPVQRSPVGTTIWAAFCVLSAGLPELPSVPLASQESNKTHLSAAAQCFLSRNLRAGTWYWTPSVHGLITLFYSSASAPLEMRIRKHEKCQGFKPETGSRLQLIHAPDSSGEGVACESGTLLGTGTGTHTAHALSSPCPQGSGRERDSSAGHSNATHRPDWFSREHRVKPDSKDGTGAFQKDDWESVKEKRRPASHSLD